MAVRLRFEGIDEDTEERDFSSLDEAITYAVSWFVDGYDNDTITQETRDEVKREDAVRLADDLRHGRTFHCGKFHERVSFVDN